MFDCILLIAGKGERTKLSYNKVFYKINDKPIYKYALETFLGCKDCHKVIIVSKEDELNIVKKDLSDINLSRVEFALGGIMRQDSVYNGIKKCESEVVLIHDGARPLISEKHITNVYENALQYLSSVLAVKTIDTIKEIKDGKTRTLNREFLWNIQTPQGVKLEYFKKAIIQAQKEKYYSTDDVSLLEKYLNISPTIVEGSYKNIKATTKDDIDFISYLIKEKKHV